MQAGGGVIHEDYHLQARTDSIKTITTMISTLLLKGSQGINGPIASCKVEEEGIRLTVSEAKSMQATAYLKRNLFHEWQFVGRAVSAAEPRALSFGLNLGTFVECLRILGGRDGGRGDTLDKPATLRLEYRSSTAAFQLTLVEGAAVTECRLRTLETEDDETLVMDEEVAAKVVLKSDSLREGIGELEWGGDNASHRSKRMTLRVALSPPQLSFTVSSVDLGCEMVYPVDALLRFDAAGGVEFDYRFALLSTALRSLRDSEETQMRIGRNGLLEILLKFSCDGKSFFVDVRILPLVDEDSDDQFDHGGVNDDGD